MFRIVGVCLVLGVGFYVLAVNAVLISFGVCQTPSGLAGHCVPLADCKSLYDLILSAAPSEAQIEYLRRSFCGSDVNGTTALAKNRVCCGDNPNVKNNDPYSGKILPVEGSCGVTFNTRIFGGVDSSVDEFPWSALIKYRRPYNASALNCAGVLINQRYVLSAAHCLRNPSIPTTWKLDSIRLGEWDISTDPDCFPSADGKGRCVDPYVEVKIERIIIHEKYIPHSQSEFYDIALLRMAESVNYSDTIRPICLPINPVLRQMTFEKEYADVAGWGRTEISPYSTVKQTISLGIWNTDACASRFKTIGISLIRDCKCAQADKRSRTHVKVIQARR
ncbi:unnamed protein product [Ceratitis capitata]|uniref:CLIP domain-containing serine protease n=1 Tax=Ceratitis capitata TaxID=7213 RepID=A0A811U2W5_CERCA|nr:unnamed protein product [Ceratitis capitata]